MNSNVPLVVRSTIVPLLGKRQKVDSVVAIIIANKLVYSRVKGRTPGVTC